MAKNIFSRVSRTPATSTHLNTLQHMEFFLSLVKSFRPLINVLKNSVLVVVGVLDTPLISQSCRLQDCKLSKISPWKIFKNFHWRNIAMQCMKAFCRTPLFTNYYFITYYLITLFSASAFCCESTFICPTYMSYCSKKFVYTDIVACFPYSVDSIFTTLKFARRC